MTTVYNKLKLLNRIMSELDLSFVTRFTDETIIDASDSVPRRFVTLELVVPEPKAVPEIGNVNRCTAIIKVPNDSIVLYETPRKLAALAQNKI